MDLNRKRVTKEQKISILNEHFEQGTPLSELARLYGIHPVTLYQWKRSMTKKEESVVSINAEELIAENLKLKKDVERLTKALGNAHLDVECSHEIIEILKKKYQEHQLKQLKKSSKK